jgi:hypothetical protein
MKSIGGLTSFFFFGNTGVLNSGSLVVYHLSHAPVLFAVVIFQIESNTFAWKGFRL